jgi:hypothetical protein
VLAFFNAPGPNWWSWVLVPLCIGHGIDVIADIFLDAWKRRDKTKFVLGLWLLPAAAVAGYIQLPAKLLIPSAPAMALLIARQMGESVTSIGKRTMIAVTAIAGVVVSVLVIMADRDWAEIGRAGGRVAAREIAAGHAVWMDGASGFQWYGMQVGAEPLAPTPPLPKQGDIIVASLYSKLIRKYYSNHITLVERRVYNEPGGRIQDEGAGFFTNWKGPWPWTWGYKELGRIEVWQVTSPLP